MYSRKTKADIGASAPQIPTAGLVFVVVIAALLSGLGHIGEAEARSAKCTHYAQQLASLTSGPRPRRSRSFSARYSRAIKAQKAHIRKLDRRLRRTGCLRSRGLFEKLFDRQCSALRGQRRRMTRNLAGLQSNEGTFSGRSTRSSKKAIRRVKRNMRRARCDVTVASLRTIAGASREEIRRERKKQRKNNRKQRSNKRSVEESLSNYNTFKTMCVRSCDGHYFPVSFSTTQSLFKKDAKACDKLCPGAQMRLYYHRTTGETVENMISVKNGELYTKLQTAFAYRKNFNSQCGCNYKLLHRDAVAKKVLVKDELRAETLLISRIAKPAFRIDKGQDPETLMTMQGDMTVNQIDSNQSKTVQQNQQIARRIRTIGEEFFPSR